MSAVDVGRGWCLGKAAMMVAALLVLGGCLLCEVATFLYATR